MKTKIVCISDNLYLEYLNIIMGLVDNKKSTNEKIKILKKLKKHVDKQLLKMGGE